MTEYKLSSTDGYSQLNCYEWAPAERPKAILQIAHGMAEHMARYEGLALYLNQFGILVAGNDHIGHGKTADPKDWGFFGVQNGWKHIVDDVERYRRFLDEKYPETPHYLLGHSMGSFVCRVYLSKYGQALDGAIIMGTAGTNKSVKAGASLVEQLRKVKGHRFQSDLVTKMAFGSYLKRIPKARTPYDWLTRDDAAVNKYMEDPACGFTFTLAGYADLFHFLDIINTDLCYATIPTDKPYLVVAGAEDPVGNYGEGPAEVAGRLSAKGCPVGFKLYPDMRHEILNEFGKESVYEDIKKFILG